MVLIPRGPRTNTEADPFATKLAGAIGNIVLLYTGDRIRLRRQEIDTLMRTLDVGKEHDMFTDRQQEQLRTWLMTIDAKLP